MLEKIFFVKERYDTLEADYLDEIDDQVRRYTRATTQKIENLTNRDHNVRGNLNYLLSALSRNRRASELLDQLQPMFEFYEQSFLSEKSLWYRKRPRKRTIVAPVEIEDTPSSEGDSELIAMLHSRYGKAAVLAFMRERFGNESVRYSKDLQLSDDTGYIMSLLAVLNSSDTGAFYHVEELDGSYKEGVYSIPQLRFVRKEEKK